MLGGGGEGLEGHPGGRPAGQQALAPSRGQQQRLLPFREAERVGDGVDGLGGLAEQHLGGGVSDDGAAEVGAQDVFGVLGDHGQPGPVLAGGLGHPEQEPGAFGLTHQQPRLIHHDEAAPAAGRVGDLPPHGVQGEQGGDGLEFVGDVAEGERDQVPGGAGGRRPGEHPGMGAFGERHEPVRQRHGRLAAVSAQRGGQVRELGAGRVQVRGSEVIPAWW